MHSLLTPWGSFAELDDVRAAIDRVLESDGQGGAWRMALDVVERDHELVVHADVPGIKPEEVEIAVENGVLTISGEHSETEEEKGKRFVRKERRRGSFRRSMPLPEGVAPEDVRAQIHDGVLSVTVPLPEREPAKRIEITPTSE